MPAAADLRLVAPVAFGWAVLALLVGAPRWLALGAGLGAAAAGGWLWWLGRPGGRAAGAGWAGPVSLALLVAGLMGLAAGVQGLAWEASAVARLAAAGQRAEVVFRLDEPARARASPWGGAASVVARGKVWLAPGGPGVPAAAYLEGEAPAAGAVLEFRGRLALGEPGAPERVVVQALEAVAARAPEGWRGLVYQLRAGLLARASPLLAGIALGDTSRVEPDLDAAMKATSLTHITAVSGAHVAIVLGLVLGLAALAGAPRWLAAALGAATLAAFACLIGPGPSVLRAVAMGAAAVLGLASGRPRLALGALGAAAALVLLANPWLARSYGLVLSALATAALIALAPPLARWLRRLMPRLPRGVAEAAALTGSAQLVCAPVIAVFAGQVSLTALPANLLAAPAIPVATVAGLAALALGPLWPGGAGAAAAVGNLAAAWIAWVGRWVASWPLAAIAWPAGLGGFALACGATAALVVAARWLGRRRSRLRGWVAAGLAAAVILAGPLRGPVSAALGRAPPSVWAVAVCDVGQGTAVALRSGPAAAVMVDAGPAGGGVGECLGQLGVERLDAVILTHFHADHVGGLAEALAGRAVGEVVYGAACGEVEAAGQVARLAQAAGAVQRQISRAAAAPGPVRGAAGQVQLAVYPPAMAALCPSQAQAAGESAAANNASLAVLAQVGGLEVWLLGDLEELGQDALLADLPAARPPGAGGVVVAAHHGSASQSAALAQALAPKVAVMSAGRDNPYGHPSEGAIALYSQTAEIRRTDTEGLVALSAGQGR
ncbi:MAG: ComEC/Rec2 family competence protein [Bifidobacteriaceae bacterium]|jgi:competence protein ComEC|nr:ComEC/Rec2 family competence protein [Bifidobacteriaceae bacterium]